MRSGLLREQISVFSKQEIRDDFGGLEYGEVEITKVRAAYEPKRGSLRIVNGVQQENKFDQFRTRFTDQIKEDMIIQYKGDKYQIKSAVPRTQKRQELIIDVELINE